MTLSPIVANLDIRARFVATTKARMTIKISSTIYCVRTKCSSVSLRVIIAVKQWAYKQKVLIIAITTKAIIVCLTLTTITRLTVTSSFMADPPIGIVYRRKVLTAEVTEPSITILTFFQCAFIIWGALLIRIHNILGKRLDCLG